MNRVLQLIDRVRSFQMVNPAIADTPIINAINKFTRTDCSSYAVDGWL